LRVIINEDALEAGQEEALPLGFTIEATRATVKIPPPTMDPSFFRIVRGAVINGTPSTISTIWFKIIEYKYDGKFVELTGEPLHRSYQSITANSDYETVIESALVEVAAGVSIIPNYEGTAAWKAYQFYPTGRTIVLSPRKKLFTILQQKYLIFATEDGWDGSQDNMFFFVATDARNTDYTVTDQLFNYNARQEFRKIISRDEASVIRSDGASTSPIHNLGFLHSTASLPTNSAVQQAGSRTSKIPVHLKYRTGDKVDFASYGVGINPSAMRVNVIEVLDLQSTPAWYMILEALQWFGTTEGGAMPSTIEAAAPYTPLTTGNFDGILSVNDNNLQAAMETIDDHTHTGISTEEIQDTVGAMFSGNTETGITATYQDADGTIDLVATGGLTYNAATVTTGNVTAVSGNHYDCTIAGLTADRDFNLPTPGAAGEKIALRILDGDDTYELIIKANSTEITRVFIAGEYMEFMSYGTGAGDWRASQDGRIPCFAEMDRITSNANTTHSANTKTTVDWNNIPRNRGELADTANDRFNIRRAGQYEVSFQFRPAASVTDQKYLELILFGGASGTTEFGFAVNRVASTGAATLCVISNRPVTCAVADQIVAQFATEEANIGMLRNDAGDQSTGGSWYSIKEVL